MRGPALGDAPARRVPEHAHPLPDPIIAKDALHLATQLLLRHDAVRARRHRQAGLPHVADVALVLELVREVWPAQERHPVPHPFHGRVPPAVRHEARHRTVRQHTLLGAPADDHAHPPTRCRNASSHALLRPAVKSGRTTHRNGRPVSSSPSASSSNWHGSNTVKLPNATYTTERSGWASSHSRHLVSSGKNCPTGFLSCRSSVNRGPMGRMFGYSSNAPGSASTNELQIMFSARSFASLLRITSWKMARKAADPGQKQADLMPSFLATSNAQPMASSAMSQLIFVPPDASILSTSSSRERVHELAEVLAVVAICKPVRDANQVDAVGVER
nr:unnamed protein product [Digitaria exilis]